MFDNMQSDLTEKEETITSLKTKVICISVYTKKLFMYDVGDTFRSSNND